MVRHVVMWNFKDEVKEEDKAAHKEDMKKSLESLRGKVPGLVELDFIANPLSSSSHDMALVTLHDNAEALATYAGHPEHVKVADTYIRPFTKDRAALDYEL